MSFVGQYDKQSLVERILEQGQRLRNSMVQSILNNDPLNAEVLYSKHFTTPVSSVELNGASLSKLDDKKLQAFLKGDYMSKDEEKLALDTFRSMSDVELCRATDRMYNGFSKKCHCSTCKEYYSKDLYCDIKRANDQLSSRIHQPETNKITDFIENQNRSENCKYLKFVDSVKITVFNLVLNEAGNKKVSSEKTKVPSNSSETFFLEYQVPDCLLKHSVSKSKVNSGLDDTSVRVCARRHYHETINFKQTFIHEIEHVNSANLLNSELKIKVTYRNARQKTASLLGYAFFHFKTFEVSKNLTCNRGLQVVLNDRIPIVLGTLKVSLQLGCGKLYFGEEFINAINSNDANSVALGSEDSAVGSNRLESEICFSNQNSGRPTNSNYVKKYMEPLQPKPLIIKEPNISPKKIDNTPKKPTILEEKQQKQETIINKTPRKLNPSKSLPQQQPEKPILFGFLYIPEAQYLSEPINSYLTCQPFCQNDTISSRLVTCSSSPVFNFYQSVPVVFDNDLLLQFRENYTVIEFWKKNERQDQVFGLTKIPLHSFYIGYRNPVILKYLNNNKLPVVGVDWWEPIYHHETDEVIGQVQILIALGTEQQIKNLEIERGFKTDFVRAKPSLPITLPKTPRKSILKQDIAIQTVKSVTISEPRFREQTTNTTPREHGKKVDIGVQHSTEMEGKDNSQNNLPEMLEGFFKQLAESNRNRTVENSTNTDDLQTNGHANLEVRKTSDLLNSLEQALSVNPTNGVSPKKTFKANVNIIGALHLPSRKKAKSKKSKCRAGKLEESVLPSTYVTFETTPGDSLKITPVISKSTNPEWNYQIDVVFPSDLLFNNQKRLIFKIWRKSTNTNMVPNMQTDMVLGFAALDLTVLRAGLPNVQGWFNIVDFTGKCNGQININVTPLENLSTLQQSQMSPLNIDTSVTNGLDFLQQSKTESEPGELLSRALKRKFTELDEITQRLRLRLSTVTNEESDTSNDDVTEEFERDINTLSVEEDFDLINFEEEAKKFNINHDASKSSSILSLSTDKECNGDSEVAQSNNSLDRHLKEGKQRIDTLLEKLTLMSADSNPFASRYVSGCSTTNENPNLDTEALLKELDHSSRPNIMSRTNFDAMMFQELYGASSSNSESSLQTNPRQAPDGQGGSEEKITTKQTDKQT